VATPLPTLWHALDAASVVKHLGADASAGLSSQAVAQRTAEHGPNALPEPPKRPVFLVFLRQFKSPLIYILFIAAALAAGMDHWGDAVVILAVVLVNALIGSYQEGRAERSMAALRRLSALQVRVLRDGHERAILARHLVPGDILLLATDGRTWQQVCANAPWDVRAGHHTTTFDDVIYLWAWNPKDGIDGWRLVTDNVWGCADDARRDGKSDFMLEIRDGRIWTFGGDREVISPWPQDNDVWVAELPMGW
jgi:hypothetical protein